MFFGSESISILVLCNKQSDSLVFWRWCDLWEKHQKVTGPKCTRALGSTFTCNVQAYLSAHSHGIYFSVNHYNHKCGILHVQIPELTNKLTSTLLVICFLCGGRGDSVLDLHFPNPPINTPWKTETTCVEQITIGCNPTGHQCCEWQPNTKRWAVLCSSIWHWVKHTKNGNTDITNRPHSGHPETTSADFNRSMRCTHPRWPNFDNYRQQSTACNWIQCHTGNDVDFEIPCCQQVPRSPAC